MDTIDGLTGGRRALSGQVVGNGVPLTPQMILPRNGRRLYAAITNKGTNAYELQFGEPDIVEGQAGTSFLASLWLKPDEMLVLDKDDTRRGGNPDEKGLCEWTGTVYSTGMSVTDYMVTLEVSHAA